jgi:2-succinyl-5-enolpyruvyl-6-hydroxy-3-cyclohexene-1-carboxylate synthase
VSKVVNGFLAFAVEGGARSILVDPWDRWSDPERQAAVVVRCDPTLFCIEATRRVKASMPGVPDSGERQWAGDWRDAEARAQAAIGDALGTPQRTERAEAGGRMTEPSLARRLVARLPGGTPLLVSSSMPIRDVEAFAAPRRQPPRVLSNRGANGIDGVVSTALGVALGTGHPTVVLVGDLAFLHDVSALVHADGFTAPLTVVVADNAGGGIFSFLDPATVLDPGSFDLLFGTPQAPDVAAVAAAFGWPVDDVARGEGPEFEEALDRRLAGGGLSVIRVRLPGRSDNVAIHHRISAAIVAAVDEGAEA